MQTIFQNPELSSFLIMSFQAIWPDCPRPCHFFYSLGRDHCLVPWRRRVWNLPLDSTSRITTLCREQEIVVGLMTDARFSGGSVGLVIGHVGPEAAIGGPIAYIEDGDDIVVDLNSNEINCPPLDNDSTLSARKASWDKAVTDNGGTHPAIGGADTRLLNRMRRSAVSAVFGAGMHPDRELWVPAARAPEMTGFGPSNKYRKRSAKAF